MDMAGTASAGSSGHRPADQTGGNELMTPPVRIRMYPTASDVLRGSFWTVGVLAGAATVYFGGAMLGAGAPVLPGPAVSINSATQRQRTEMLPGGKRPDPVLVAKVRLAAVAVALPEAPQALSQQTRTTLPRTAPETVWDDIAQCESSGNWSINTGNGFHGGLQFTPSTWQAFGGPQYASSAEYATREQQITVAQKVQASQGWNAWPVCSKKAQAASRPRAEVISAVLPATPAPSTHAITSVHGPAPAPAVAAQAPAASSTPTPGPADTVVVRSGDSLSTIANEHGVAGGWQSLYQHNKTRLANPNLIHPGQRLDLPTAATSPPAKAASDGSDKTADKAVDKTAVTAPDAAKPATLPADSTHPFARELHKADSYDHSSDHGSDSAKRKDDRSDKPDSIRADGSGLILTGPSQQERAWLTGHTWANNNNNKNANKLSDPVVHDQPGGTGTYADPISASVPPGADRVWKVGARFYLPTLKRYAIVEDAGASLPPSNQEGHLDLWIGDRSDDKTAVDECLDKITQDNAPVELNPPANRPVTPGALFQGAACQVSPRTTTRAAQVATDAVPSAALKIPHGAPTKTMLHTTGYSFQDNQGGDNATISCGVIHKTAGGTGSYADPITVAVPGHAGQGTQMPCGTEIYMPDYKRYFIVEDTGATNYADAKHIDIYVGGEGVSAAASRRCMDPVTTSDGSPRQAIINPLAGLPTEIGPITGADGRCDVPLGGPGLE